MPNFQISAEELNLSVRMSIKQGAGDGEKLRKAFDREMVAADDKINSSLRVAAEPVLAETFLRLMHLEIRQAVASRSKAFAIGVRDPDASEGPEERLVRVSEALPMEAEIFARLVDANLRPRLLDRRSDGKLGNWGKDEIFESTLINDLYDISSDISGDLKYSRTSRSFIVIPL